MATMHEVDYEIVGDDMQFVKIELDPGEAVVSEAGSMMYIEDGIEMQTIFGDGSQHAGRLHGRAAQRGQARHRGRVAVHDRVPQPGAGQAQGRVRRALPGPHPGRQALRTSAAS